MAQRRFTLSDDAIPRRWYNVAADLPSPPPPPLHPGTGQPVGPDDLAPLFPMALIMQEVSGEPRIEIPDQVRDIYASGGRRRSTARAGWSRRSIRPRTSTTSTRASARPAATSRTPRSPRPTTTSDEGVARLATETGAGQWGSALAFACSLFGLECKVYMVRAALPPEAVPPLDDPDLRREVFASPSTGHERRPRRPGERPGLARAAWASRSPRRSRTRRPTRTPTTRSAGC